MTRSQFKGLPNPMKVKSRSSKRLSRNTDRLPMVLAESQPRRSSDIYREYQALRKTPAFKLWWANQFAKQRAECYYCECSLKQCRVNVEHIVPMGRGGTNSKRNMVLSCAKCNKEKGSKLLNTKVRKRLRARLMAKVTEDRSAYKRARHTTQSELDYQAELAAWYRQNL